MAKGSGMIEPLMATMLGVVTTDAAVAPALLQRALKAAVDDTFNAITVDGECSTNDCVFVLANGASGVELTENDWPLLVGSAQSGLRAAGDRHRSRRRRRNQARDCSRDRRGIGRRRAGARRAPSPTRRSSRRPSTAATRTGAVSSPWPDAPDRRSRLEKAVVRIGPITLFADGTPYDERAPQAAAYLQGHEIDLEVDPRHRRAGQSQMWTCDLSAEYVRINADYRT